MSRLFYCLHWKAVTKLTPHTRRGENWAPPLERRHTENFVDIFLFGPHLVVSKILVNFSPTFCDPMECSPPGSSVPGISQARILKWLAIHSPALLETEAKLCMDGTEVDFLSVTSRWQSCLGVKKRTGHWFSPALGANSPWGR